MFKRYYIDNGRGQQMGMYDFIAIDFETANNSLASACSIGLAMVKDQNIVKTEEYLIKPPGRYFNKFNIAIHGITPDTVKNAPRFDELWSQINCYFRGNETIIAHNAQFDMSVLVNCLSHYDLELPEFQYLCSISLAKKACNSMKMSYSLKALTQYFGITLTHHHNALADAVACAELVIKCLGSDQINRLESYCLQSDIRIRNFSELKADKTFFKDRFDKDRYDFDRISVKEIAASCDKFDESHIFFGRNIVLTGELEQIDRKSAMQMIADVGGMNKSAVSSKTDFLIMGKQDRKLVGNGGMSTKEEKAHALIAKGHSIRILSESDFLKLVNKM